MIDTHCHLDHKQFDADRAETLERAFAGGVTHIVVPAIEPERFDGVVALAASDARIYYGIGIHPHAALKATDEALARVEELSFGEKARAIGEIGLDYHYDFAPRETQREVFRRQLRIAKRRNLPVIVHNRESDDDVMNILEEEQDGSLRGVLHCYSGAPEQLERVNKLAGFYYSFTGNITFKKSTLSETIQIADMEKLMIETDAPYMSPEPYRGKRNEPMYVRLVAEKIAALRSLSVEEVIRITSQNARRFFHLSLAVLTLAFATSSVFAQTDDDDDYVEPPNLFAKTIGVGGLFGQNQVADLTSRGTFTYTGVAIGPGASMAVYLSDYFALNASYIFGVNTQITGIDPQTGMPRQPRPNEHQAFDLSLQWIANPSNILNFHFMAGASYVTNNYNQDSLQSYWGFHVNIIGVSVNIKTPIGIFYPGIEWRANVVLGLDETKSYGLNDTRTLNGFTFSVPRFTFYWFPNFSGK
jgi:TatD DNase family protein